eukprot:TRINITY_DN1285_c0_g2_i1.p1 TRINITY_DN1285_c0_g2~~TRINITY_DN1285_c0_g2_i1.p1  ORF type:complete len:213 (+),score=31.94 TRINITY_DN1285_c0_g2_i1:499-1137(+)
MHVGTRTTTQARSHAQKYFAKLEKTAASPRKDSLSHSSTTANSPISKPPTVPDKKVQKRRSNKAIINELQNYTEGQLLEVKTKLAEPSNQSVGHIMQNASQSETEEEFIVINEYLPQLIYPIQSEPYFANQQPSVQEIEFDADILFPEPIRPLELTTCAQPLVSLWTEPESSISIDFSNVLLCNSGKVFPNVWASLDNTINQSIIKHISFCI